MYNELPGENAKNFQIMEAINRLHLEGPFGRNSLHGGLCKTFDLEKGVQNRIRRLMRKMGIIAICPRKWTTTQGCPSGIPVLLRDPQIVRPGEFGRQI